MGLKYWSGAHTKHRLLYHLVWLPKYRKRVLDGDVAIRLQNLLYEAAQVNRWWIDELKIMPDHVHLMVQAKQIAYHDRDRWLADPMFASVPMDINVMRDGKDVLLKEMKLQ